MSKKKEQKVVWAPLDPSISNDDLKKMEEDGEFYSSPLMKSVINTLDNHKKITRLSFEEDPTSVNKFGGLYYDKINLLPDRIIKRISVVSDLTATCIRTRGTQISSFGHILQDRLSTGYRVEPKKDGEFEKLPEDEKVRILREVQKVTKLLYNCGHTKKWDEQEKMTLPTFLYLSTCNAVRFGRFATEVIYTTNSRGEKEFYSIRPTDPSTIFKAIPHSNNADALRKEALRKLERIKNEKLVPERFVNNEYAFIQVIEGQPVQAFTSEEMIVHNCYPVTDIESNGYPVTPIDIAISHIVTHINIVSHNKLYFQNGRAAKGMLVISSEDVDPGLLQDLKQNFNANINSVQNSWRMPIIKVGQQDKVAWQAIDSTSRDAEFQYLMDSNHRVILSVFGMSPEEVPGYSHLSRGTNSQALSESNNEYKLEAHRDVGIRPLLASMEDFLNSRILPLMNEEVAKYCTIRLYGLDAETPEKESTRIREEQELFGSLNDTLKEVDKEPIDKEYGGDFIMNPMFGQLLDKYLTVGQVKEYFLGHKGAAKDPRWDYVRDQFYFNQVQLIQQQEAAKQQQAMAEEQLKLQAQGKQQGQDDGAKDLASGADKAIMAMHKSEGDLKKENKALLDKQNEVVKEVMDLWEKESEKVLAEISKIVIDNKEK